MDRRILITCLVLLLAVCLCLSAVAIFGAVFWVWDSETISAEPQQQETYSVQNPTTESQQPVASPTQNPTVEPQQDGESPTQSPTPEPQDREGEPAVEQETTIEIEPATIAEMELIQLQVIQDRGLEPSGTFTRTLFSQEQLRQHVLDDFLEDYSAEEAQEDAILLEAFGLLNSDFDLFNFYLDLYTEQIAGFYDNETKEMVVVQGNKFGGLERLTYAHEYTHALQDQNYDVRNGLEYSDDSCENDSERCAAIQALMEGDATQSELNWFMNHATPADRTDILEFYSDSESPVLETGPEFIAKDLFFPYEEGHAFVQYLYDRGGWDAVDQAYANLPVSTEQILHPERYPGDKPIPINLPNLSTTLGEGWEEIDQDVLGEWYTYLVLAYGLDEDARVKEGDAADAAEGWGGDAFIVFYNADADSTVMVLRTLWESSSEVDEFVETFNAYARDRFGRPKVDQADYILWENNSAIHTLHIDSVYTTWIFAPDETTANSLWTVIQNE